jgi:hypothetical protein
VIRGKALEEGIEEAVIAVTDVDPLSDEEQKAGRAGVGWIEAGKSHLGAVEHGLTCGDAAEVKDAVELVGKFAETGVKAIAVEVIRFGRWRRRTTD